MDSINILIDKVASLEAAVEALRDDEDFTRASSHPLLTVGAVAERLGVSSRTVYRYMRRGELGFVMIGRGRRVSKEALDLYIRSRSRTGG